MQSGTTMGRLIGGTVALVAMLLSALLGFGPRGFLLLAFVLMYCVSVLVFFPREKWTGALLFGALAAACVLVVFSFYRSFGAVSARVTQPLPSWKKSYTARAVAALTPGVLTRSS
jgi:hypothetical protein